MLSLHQERDAALVDRGGGRFSPCLVKCNQGCSRGISVTIHRLGLSPSSVRTLGMNQITYRRTNCFPWGADSVECPEAENPVFGVPSCCLQQPIADEGRSLGDPLLLFRNAPLPKGAQGKVRRREVTIF